jgi:predicted nucleic acid-binding protein
MAAVEARSTLIAVDTSSLVLYLAGGHGKDIDLVDQALSAKRIVMPPVVLAEVLSAPREGERLAEALRSLPILEITEGFWERAGLLRGRVLGQRRKARLGDALIAQACLDHDVALLTRDRDFRHYTQHGLRLLP